MPIDDAAHFDGPNGTSWCALMDFLEKPFNSTPLTARVYSDYTLSMGKWKFDFDARHPQNPCDVTWKVGVHSSYYEHLRRQKHQAPFARIILLQQTFQDTESIYSGWSRPDKDDCFVYVAKPTSDHQSMTIEKPSPPNMLFLVFVLNDGTIDFWNWREMTQGSAMPDGVKGKLLWHRT